MEEEVKLVELLFNNKQKTILNINNYKMNNQNNSKEPLIPDPSPNDKTTNSCHNIVSLRNISCKRLNIQEVNILSFIVNIFAGSFRSWRF